MLCKFQPGVFGCISFIVSYENSLSYFPQAKTWGIVYCIALTYNSRKAWMTLIINQETFLRPQTDFTARQMLWKEKHPTPPAMQTLNLQLASWKKVIDTCLEHFSMCAGHQLIMLNCSFSYHSVYFLDDCHTFFTFYIYLPSWSADKMLENSMPVPFDSKVYWFLNNINLFDSWQLFPSAWFGWCMKNQLLTARLAFILWTTTQMCLWFTISVKARLFIMKNKVSQMLMGENSLKHSQDKKTKWANHVNLIVGLLQDWIAITQLLPVQTHGFLPLFVWKILFVHEGTSGFVPLNVDGNKNMVKPLYWTRWIAAVPFHAVSKEQFTIQTGRDKACTSWSWSTQTIQTEFFLGFATDMH